MKPTAKQLAYLRTLAQQTATTFTYPASAAQASAEIRRLKTLAPSTPADARREQREVQDDLATRPNDAVAFQAHEITGHGSTARWSTPPEQRPRVYSRRKGTATPPAGAVYVGRPSVYGNPFPIGPDGRDACIARYEEWLYEPEQQQLRDRATCELRGRDLVCWCAPDACHADVLLTLVNDDDQASRA